MSDENVKKIEPSVQAADSTELTEKDLEAVTGGDKATNSPLPTENLTLTFQKIEYKYGAQ